MQRVHNIFDNRDRSPQYLSIPQSLSFQKKKEKDLELLQGNSEQNLAGGDGGDGNKANNLFDNNDDGAGSQYSLEFRMLFDSGFGLDKYYDPNLHQRDKELVSSYFMLLGSLEAGVEEMERSFKVLDDLVDLTKEKSSMDMKIM